MARGLRDQEIADELGIRKWTVRRHGTNIKHKLGVRNRVSVAVYWLTGWLPSDSFARRLDYALSNLDKLGKG